MLEGQIKYAELLKTAYEEYLQIYLCGDLKPSLSYLKYEFDFINDKNIGIFGNEMIEADLREVTNVINEWNNLLHRWYAWNTVLESYNEDRQKEWKLESEFLKLIIDKCLFVPSRIKDTFINVGIENFHQIRLATHDKYDDKIEKHRYDPRIRALDNKLIHNYPSRKNKEEILEGILSFCNHKNFLDKLQGLNNDEYQRQLTQNYRNLSSHSIAPRITAGTVSPITRTIEKTTRMQKNTDGSFSKVEVEDKTSVVYSYGGTEPLDRNQLFDANVEEFKEARNCYDEFKKLLKKTISEIPN